VNFPSSIPDFLEIAVLAGFFYVVLEFLVQTRGTGVIRGLTILFTVFFVSSLVLIESLDLVRLKHVYDSILSIAVIGLIVVFQPEIRRAITELGENRILSRFFRKMADQEQGKVVEELTVAMRNMARRRIGALIAIEHTASLNEFIGPGNKGTPLDSEVNGLLIESIFQPGSPLHDGGLLIRDGRIIGAGCMFPLSQNPEISKRLGTRHHAALGLSEKKDAVVLVVSEETSAISVAINGELHQDLKQDQLREFIAPSAPIVPTETEESATETPAHG
jgi:diadenylate cyclase